MENYQFRKVLLIQTAFLGDVILSTSLLETLHVAFPQAELHFLLRQGNEGVFEHHPFLQKCWIWNKRKHKLFNAWKLIKQIRRERFDLVITIQRFASAGLFTVFSKAKQTVGFSKNPFSWFFTYRYPHRLDHLHEVERNLILIQSFTHVKRLNPQLYPSDQDRNQVKTYQSQPYICVAPASVWFTKQFPESKWVEFLDLVPSPIHVYLLGSPADRVLADRIQHATKHPHVKNLSGKLTILESAALMQGAKMNYVNDSAPLHIASAMNAPVCAIFCSTIPAFGFGPLSDQSHIVEIGTKLSCRPCGLHGRSYCPEAHFRCALDIDVKQLLSLV